MVVATLPFKELSSSLQENLRHAHIPRLCRWLIGPGPTGVLAIASGSNWEAALTVEFLLWARNVFEQHNEECELRGEITRRVVATASHLLSTAKVEEGTGKMASWDSVTWDTAVVARALLVTAKACPTEFPPTVRTEIDARIEAAVQWLIWRFDVWDNVKFPFGVCDIAQILITLAFLRSVRPDLLKRARRCGYLQSRPSGRVSVESAIATYLLKEATVVEPSAPHADSKEPLLSWGNFFHTAEVLEALAVSWSVSSPAGHTVAPYLPGCLRGEFDRELERRQRCAIIAGLRFLETSQLDGEWGTHVDTMRCLYAYVRASYMLGEQPESHLVFRAIRWVLDEKQVFDDGSFLHTMFLTIFYAISLREVYDRWDTGKKMMSELYDDVVWASPARTSAERGRRLQAEIERDDERRKNTELAARVGRWARTFWTGFTLVAAVALLVTAGYSCGVIEPFRFADGLDYKLVIPVVAVAVTTTAGTIFFLWNKK
jgi:hypothetical protein